MTISVPNTSITLNVHKPKKDAIVFVGAPTVGFNDMSIYAGANINPGLTQSINGGFRVLLARLLAELSSGNIQNVHMPLGGGSADVVVNGVATADDLEIEIGQNLGSNETDRSHFIDRTFKRLLEVWLETNQ